MDLYEPCIWQVQFSVTPPHEQCYILYICLSVDEIDKLCGVFCIIIPLPSCDWWQLTTVREARGIYFACMAFLEGLERQFNHSPSMWSYLVAFAALLCMSRKQDEAK